MTDVPSQVDVEDVLPSNPTETRWSQAGPIERASLGLALEHLANRLTSRASFFENVHSYDDRAFPLLWRDRKLTGNGNRSWMDWLAAK